jgi:mono/diheme cytochrome c family protein
VTAVRSAAASVLLALASCAPARRYQTAEPALVRREPLADISGPVLAMADDGIRRVVLGERGGWVLRAGSLERSGGARPWRKAALIPAADGRGSWAVGLDRDGALWRVRPGGGLEAISDRYGLSGAAVADLAPAGGRLVAFLLPGAVAIADGRRVLRFSAPQVRALAAGGRTAALLFPARVDLLDLAPLQDGKTDRPRRLEYPIARARAIAVDARGVLFVATDRAVYQAAADRELRLVYEGRRIEWMAGAGTRLWLADEGQVLVADDGPPRPVAARATAAGVGAGDGALWLLDGGAPVRLVPDRTSAAEARWEESIRPLFTRACADCHRPDGRSGVDLSSAGAWLASREEILQRVVVARTMPPAGRGLSEDDRAAVRRWLTAAP